MRAIGYSICMLLSVPVLVVLFIATGLFGKDYVAFYMETLNQKFSK